MTKKLPLGIRKWGKGYQYRIMVNGKRVNCTCATLEDAISSREFTREILQKNEVDDRKECSKNQHAKILMDPQFIRLVEREQKNLTRLDEGALPKGIRIKNGKFQANINIDQHRHWATFADLIDAIKWRFKVICDSFGQPELDLNLSHIKNKKHTRISGKIKKTTKWTLQEAYEYTLKYHWSGNRSLGHVIRNSQYALDFFGRETELSDITEPHIEEFKFHLKERFNNAPSTVNRKLATLSKILNTSLSIGKIQRKPAIRKFRERPNRVRFLSPEEEQSFIQAFEIMKRSDHKDAFCILLDTGMRPSELWNLEVRDVDLSNKIVTIWLNKTDHPRSIPMTMRVKSIFHKRIKEITGLSGYQPACRELLFPYTDNTWFHQTWNKAKKLIGLENEKELIPYTLRHTCCSRLIQSKTSLVHVKEWMGHKCIATTLRYAHLGPDDLHELARTLESYHNYSQTVVVTTKANSPIDTPNNITKIY
ncbi:Site-specific recombinase XerD [Paucidesulfovibrio gracilis DSM 16080]|uniref:Site-specific recombinase XerD n=1 Tax=Paucidesulfovibrio gracilis DSM 16080 TaxID=1121449 RepID=A0A1T4WM96_9BACT|nr:site-specific integrase [Paucidesulfovibrio gracilis]SKA78277.1 Site-specific recombinase XerD [Paucidesulfovibrio gracilis DSM 16080]